MKKSILLFMFMASLFSLNAQTRVTKASVLGKWVLSDVQMPGIFYYSSEKDSFALGEIPKSQIKDETQQATVIAMMKTQLTMFTKMSFEFKNDNSAVLNSGIQGSQNAGYTVDSDNSTITTADKDGRKSIMKADMLGERLRVRTDSPQGEIIMILKKG